MFWVTRVTKRIDRSWHLQQNQPTLWTGARLIVIVSSITLPRSARTFPLSRTTPGVLIIMKNGLKAAALSFGVAILFGSVAMGYADTDSVDKSSESHRSETTTVAPAPAVVMVQPAPVAVVPAPEVAVAPTTHEHSSSHSSSSERAPNGDSSSEKSSSSHTSNY